MKKLLLFLVFALLPIVAIAATSYTTNYNLAKPGVGDTGWGAMVNTNFDTIDATLKSLADGIGEGGGGGGSSPVTLTSSVIHPNEATQHFGVGGTTTSSPIVLHATNKNITAHGGVIAGDGTDNNANLVQVNRASGSEIFKWDETEKAFVLSAPLIIGGAGGPTGLIYGLTANKDSGGGADYDIQFFSDNLLMFHIDSINDKIIGLGEWDLTGAIAKINWDAITPLIKHEAINWTNINESVLAGINWDNIVVSSEVDWDELPLLTRAAINWDTLSGDIKASGINWTGIDEDIITGINWAAYEGGGISEVNWSEMPLITTSNVNWDDMDLMQSTVSWEKCVVRDNVAAADDDKFFHTFDKAVVLTNVWCNYEGSAPTTAAQFTLGTGTHTSPTCAGPTSAATPQAITSGDLAAKIPLRYSVTNTPNPTTDTYSLCVSYTAASVVPPPAFSTNYCEDANALGCWLFTEGSGTTVADTSGNSRTGTFKASGQPAWNTDDVPFAVAGVAPNSVDYGDATQYIALGSAEDIDNLTAFTFTTWFRREGTGGNSVGRLFDKGHKIVLLNEVTNRIEGIVGYETTNAQSISSTQYTNNTWTHVAVTWSTVDNITRVYINGSEVSYNTQTTGAGGAKNEADLDAFLGNNSGFARGLNGKMTDTGLFGRVLSGSEILEIYNYGLGGTEL